jgi:HSP20 family molecular chaperone IbpA
MATRSDPDGWMWSHACELLADAERMHRQFFRLAVAGRTPAMWEPPIDVFEDEREIVVVVAMPGVPADGVEIGREDGDLIVRGSRPLPLGGGAYRVRQLEIPYGAFERRIALPPGRFEVGRPELLEGCLLLRVRKLGAAR